MTNLDPDQPRDGEHGVGWVTLADGVSMDPVWLSRHVTRLYSAWQHADTTLRRLQLAHLIQRAAATPDQDRDDYRSVRVEWSETTRYAADLYIASTMPFALPSSCLATLPPRSACATMLRAMASFGRSCGNSA
jgi:hypothetical protein